MRGGAAQKLWLTSCDNHRALPRLYDLMTNHFIVTLKLGNCSETHPWNQWTKWHPCLWFQSTKTSPTWASSRCKSHVPYTPGSEEPSAIVGDSCEDWEWNLPSGVLMPSGHDKIYHRPRDKWQEVCVCIEKYLWNGNPSFSVQIISFGVTW